MNQMDTALIKKIVEEIYKRVQMCDDALVPVGVSNRHIHISREDLDVLYGKGYELTKLNDLKQPGQYSAKETVKIIGPKGEFDKVRILGPVRNETQLELALTDGFKLGINPEIRESGKLENSASFIIEGPNGRVQKDYGAIGALRHIHMPPDFAEKHGIQDKEMVDVLCEGIRKTIFSNVLVRVSDKYALEMHVDTDEANASGLKNGDTVKIIKNKE